MRITTVILGLTLCVASTMAEESAALEAVSASSQHFSTAFFKEIASEKRGENLISSPLSAHIVLSMAAYGARGNTAKEMQRSLSLPADNAVGRQGFQNLIDQLNNIENVTLEVANKMYLAQGLELKPEYKQLTSDTFRSEAGEIDAGKAVESAKLVNSWVDEKTHKKINGIVKADDITPDLRMLLLNAVYFKGKWAKQFKPEATQNKVFHIDEKTDKKVPTMFTSGNFFYGELPDLQAKFIVLPYENKDLQMVIIVPDEINGLRNIEENLESFNYTRLSRSGYNRDVDLYLPKFKIESTIDLKQSLSNLGMKDMFADNADFSGIAAEPLKVGKVIQKAYIEVNEEGSEAAAVTVSMIMKMAVMMEDPIVLQIDRPFYYIIRTENIFSTTIFQGHIYDPTI